MSDILDDYNNLSHVERTAWRAWFRGAIREFPKFSDGSMWPPMMGKAECQWVSFEDFWLGKMVNLGWVEVQWSEPRNCATEGLTVKTLTMRTTEKGYDVYNAIMEGRIE